MIRLERVSKIYPTAEVLKEITWEVRPGQRIGLVGVNGAGKSTQLRLSTSDLESLVGSFHTVICLDVFIHYPQKAAEEMVQHLCSLSQERLIVSFAPYTPLLALLKAVGQFFPGPSKTTRAYILRESGIVKAAKQYGFSVSRRKLNQAPFYFSQLIEFIKDN